MITMMSIIITVSYACLKHQSFIAPRNHSQTSAMPSILLSSMVYCIKDIVGGGGDQSIRDKPYEYNLLCPWQRPPTLAGQGINPLADVTIAIPCARRPRIPLIKRSWRHGTYRYTHAAFPTRQFFTNRVQWDSCEMGSMSLPTSPLYFRCPQTLLSLWVSSRRLVINQHVMSSLYSYEYAVSMTTPSEVYNKLANKVHRRGLAAQTWGYSWIRELWVWDWSALLPSCFRPVEF